MIWRIELWSWYWSLNLWTHLMILLIFMLFGEQWSSSFCLLFANFLLWFRLRRFLLPHELPQNEGLNKNGEILGKSDDVDGEKWVDGDSWELWELWAVIARNKVCNELRHNFSNSRMQFWEHILMELKLLTFKYSQN